MAERNPKIYDRVLQELEKSPDKGSRELFQLAQSIDKSAARDTMQQFHARYYLPAKRQQKLATEGAKPTRRLRRSRKSAADSGATAAETASEPTPKRRFRRLRGAAGSNRDQIRALLLEFAQELTDAESRSSLVQALARVDNYVDKIESAAS